MIGNGFICYEGKYQNYNLKILREFVQILFSLFYFYRTEDWSDYFFKIQKYFFEKKVFIILKYLHTNIIKNFIV